MLIGLVAKQFFLKEKTAKFDAGRQLKELLAVGIKAVKSRNHHLMVRLEPESGISIPDHLLFKIPPQLQEWELFLDVAEHKTKIADKEHATVICGQNGEPLRPYYIKTGAAPTDGHAFFSLRKEVFSVTAIAQKNLVLIKNHRIQKIEGIAVVSTSIPSGFCIFGNIPKAVEMFESAIFAAKRKLNCSNCTHAHFVENPADTIKKQLQVANA